MEATSAALVSDTKSRGGCGRLADAVGNATCSQATCSGVNGGAVALMIATVTDRQRREVRTAKPESRVSKWHKSNCSLLAPSDN